MNYVYLLRCADDTLYCGWTTDQQKRLASHNSGNGAKYTRSRLPAELVYYEVYQLCRLPGMAYKAYEQGRKDKTYHFERQRKKKETWSVSESAYKSISGSFQENTKMAEEKKETTSAKSQDEINNHLRILYLYQLLLMESDQNHMLSTTQIREKMQEYHGIYMHRTTVPYDISMLRKAGIEIMSVRTKWWNYYMEDRTFSVPECEPKH